MSETGESKSGVQVGCTGLLAVALTVLFVGLKLTGNIDWSWFWVLSPIWISVLCSIGLVIPIFVGATIWVFINELRK